MKMLLTRSRFADNKPFGIADSIDMIAMRIASWLSLLLALARPLRSIGRIDEYRRCLCRFYSEVATGETERYRTTDAEEVARLTITTA